MSKLTTVEKIAPTIEEAIAEGLLELGVLEDDVNVEILDNGSRGLLGLGGRQARVRLYLKGLPEEAQTSKGETREDIEAVQLARSIVENMLEKLKVSASVDAHMGNVDEEGRQPILVEISGSDLGFLIGRHAETLNAMQFLANQMIGKQMGRWMQVVIDIEGYRARREEQLRRLASRMAEQAVKTGRRQSLEPMPASDRRIIHLALRNHQNVTTQSVGEEPIRKVTIIPKI